VQTDYYEILGLTRSASPEEIKAAYRRLARRFHPDASADPGAEDRFKEITLAYQVLRDNEKRVRYDLEAMERELEATERELNDAAPAAAPAAPASDYPPTLPPEMAPSGPRWERELGVEPPAPPQAPKRAGFFGRFARQPAEAETERARGDDVEAVAQITLEEAIRGVTVAVAVAQPERATNSGPRSSARTVDVRVPRHAIDGDRLRLKGLGASGVNGGPPGDLVVQVAYRRHHLFRQLGADAWFYLPIAPWEAVLGVVIDIPTLEKPFRVHVPAGATSGQTFRLPGRGLPKPDGGRGDLLACLRIITPGFPSETEKQLYKQLARTSRFNPRRGWE